MALQTSQSSDFTREYWITIEQNGGGLDPNYDDASVGRWEIGNTTPQPSRCRVKSRPLSTNMPYKCSAWGCSNQSDNERGIGLHSFPSKQDHRPEVQRRRKLRTDFVSAKRAQWEPTVNSRLCSVDFQKDAFDRRYSHLPGANKPSRPFLIRDEFGVVPIPTIHTTYNEEPGNTVESERAKRKVGT